MKPSEWTQILQGLTPEKRDGYLNYLSNNLLQDERTEYVVTALRAGALDQVRAGTVNDPNLLPLLSALSIFCTDCEFVMAETPEETALVEQLRSERSVAESLIYGCYRKVGGDDLPYADVEQLRPIEDQVSRDVQAMYDENPYPRWKKLYIDGSKDDANEDLLIAGCGSGRHALHNAVGAANRRVVAIDLSRTNLAYSLSKAREYGITNVRFIHADMHDIALLGQTFDRISAVGSLHHVDNPVKAIKALQSVLRPHGTLKLAIYSIRWRAAILAGIELRLKLGLPATLEGIREFRQVVYRLPESDPIRQITRYDDFFSISGCRDMLFHVKEHNYTVSDIFDLVDQAGMKLLHFQVPEGTGQTREEIKDLEQRDPSFGGPMFRVFLAHP